MKLKVIVHEAEEGGYWAEVPSIPGCATQGETLDELTENIQEAVEACLSIDTNDDSESGLGTRIRQRLEKTGGVNLELPERTEPPKPAKLSGR